ncbi:MAG TPA: four helix bundle protein, partial [Chloroflexia bacterium]|nr:four helix bundle protein [Chloroflexia bacterium]
MTEIRTYRDLVVWQKSMDLVVDIYRFARLFPADEQWGLTSQIRRAVVSIPANIAEGYGRLHRADYVRFLSIARGSLTEVETHLQIAIRLDYLNRQAVVDVWNLLQEVGRLLNGLIRSLERPKVSEDKGEYAIELTPGPSSRPPTPRPEST